jgi:hypothetical protein
MSQAITNDVKNHVALTISGNKHYITQAQAEAMLNMGKDERVTIGTTLIRMSTVAEILPLADYYDSHPEERPAQTPQNPPEEPMTPWTKERYLRAKRSMLRGIEKYIAGAEEPSKWSLDHRDKLIKQIAEIERAPDKGEYPDPIRDSSKTLPVQPYGGKA